jgi:hypothetical protein
MASTPRLSIRILQAIIHRVWTVLFFLSVISLLSLTNHWWDDILSGYNALQNWILAGIDLFRQ